ncbi:MAG: cobalamin-independent methionine synthase II family protein [Candidatus Binatia bacterium]|jgi:5-methyltetrahydropteroyltriglutamate--homocysteine methyltransferase
MQHSGDRILTTHVGSLPRSRALSELLIRQERGETIDRAALDRECQTAVRHVVGQQVACGVDVISDGEQPRVGFQTYVGLRMKGFGGKSSRPFFRDFVDFPDYATLWQNRGMATSKVFDAPQAVAEIEYAGLSEAQRECELVLEAAREHAGRYRELFMTAASPGIVATTLLNAHYDSHESYVNAVAREMRKEYEYIHSKGLLLQLDCPDLAMERVGLFQKEPLSRFLEAVEAHVEAINRALVNIPRESVRLHVCWGNWDGPHVYDVSLEDILPILYRARVGALSLELANPRHEHEMAVVKKHSLPDSMIFVPGVIDSKTNFVEHPEVVCNRILRAVDAVGDRSRVIASSDCGFGTFAGWEIVAPSVVWAKLRTLREGADLASKRLWG